MISTFRAARLSDLDCYLPKDNFRVWVASRVSPGRRDPADPFRESATIVPLLPIFLVALPGEDGRMSFERLNLKSNSPIFSIVKCRLDWPKCTTPKLISSVGWIWNFAKTDRADILSGIEAIVSPVSDMFGSITWHFNNGKSAIENSAGGLNWTWICIGLSWGNKDPRSGIILKNLRRCAWKCSSSVNRNWISYFPLFFSVTVCLVSSVTLTVPKSRPASAPLGKLWKVLFS